MTILLFGISNVGKSTTGELLAHKLKFVFLTWMMKSKRNIT